MSTLQFSPSIEDDCGSASKFFTNFVDLSASGICDLTTLPLVINFCQNKSNFAEEVLNVLVDFGCFSTCFD